MRTCSREVSPQLIKRIYNFLREFCPRQGSNLQSSGYWTDTLAYLANETWLKMCDHLDLYISHISFEASTKGIFY